jgi:uncharacterized membrane protein HdeD (DUF308 family)
MTQNFSGQAVVVPAAPQRQTRFELGHGLVCLIVGVVLLATANWDHPRWLRVVAGVLLGAAGLLVLARAVAARRR